ncbi:MAG: RAD55 family ATPase [Candidatus Woesearchaeota archaeon]
MSKNIIESPNQIKRIKTYVKGLDENMQGGIPEGHIVVVHGSAGTMKSSLCFNILYQEALLKKRTGLYISLEQSYESILKNMVNMGFDLNKINIVHIDDLTNFSALLKQVKKGQGNIIVTDVACIRKQVKDIKVSENRSWLNVVKNIILRAKKEVGIELVTFDSLRALYTVSTFENPRLELFYLFDFLRDLNLTSYMISERSYNELSDSQTYDSEAFLCDGIIDLRLTPFRRNIVREIKIDKMRATKFKPDVFSFEFKEGAFHALYGGQNPLL